MRAGRWPVQSHAHRAIPLRWSELQAMRNPMLLRFAARQLFTLLLQLPPRFTLPAAPVWPACGKSICL